MDAKRKTPVKGLYPLSAIEVLNARDGDHADGGGLVAR
jgi:hypothetical protein